MPLLAVLVIVGGLSVKAVAISPALVVARGEVEGLGCEGLSCRRGELISSRYCSDSSLWSEKKE